MNAQQFQESNHSLPARSEVVDTSVSECVCADVLTQTIGIVPDTETLSLEKSFERFAKFGVCKCEFEEKINPCRGVTIISCPVCKKEKRRVYS